MSDSDAALARAYREAVYTLEIKEASHRLAVGAQDAVLDRLLATEGVTTAARLTAANPGSAAELPKEVNAAANRQLEAELAARGFRRIACPSAAPDGAWPEHGFLVLGIGRYEAKALARAYGQRGLLWCERGRPIDLVML